MLKSGIDWFQVFNQSVQRQTVYLTYSVLRDLHYLYLLPGEVRQPVLPSAAHDKFHSICTTNDLYTEFGIALEQTVNLFSDTIRLAALCSSQRSPSLSAIRTRASPLISQEKQGEGEHCIVALFPCSQETGAFDFRHEEI